MKPRDLAQPPTLEYAWPTSAEACGSDGGDRLFRDIEVRETAASLAADSRWPAFFPSPIGLVTAGAGPHTVLERVVGPMIVNRFPLVMAVSLCHEALSSRHHRRDSMMRRIEASGAAAVQFVAPGDALAAALDAVASEPDARAAARIPQSRLGVRELTLTGTNALSEAYLVYEGRLAECATSIDGSRIYDQPWLDVGSHRIYFLEVLAIHLKTAIARGERQIAWHSLPLWDSGLPVPAPEYDDAALARQRYVKTYTPDYRFPSAGTVAFEPDEIVGDMSIRHLPRLAANQVVVDNERARWPCFFPSSAGIATAWQADGRPTAMPCGSTAVVSRLPFTFAACISNSAINERYAPRATLGVLREQGRLGIGVPYTSPDVVRAISYLGNISVRDDADKVRHAGLTAVGGGPSPLLAQLPIHFDCRVAREINLGTHVMVLAEVERIHVRQDVTCDRPLRWLPWARVV
jgi:flavin reductase (DIM6/NTAB) family NADH-FMN oxidoreductase RutF